jgi:hypothetical protein
MSYRPRIESKGVAPFQSLRTRNSPLWFVTNPSLEGTIRGYATGYIESLFISTSEETSSRTGLEKLKRS